jgi:gamma-carbonic anhydrase
MGSAPTLWQGFRQMLGRAFRETGQALDRLGVKTVSLAITKHDYYDDPVRYEDHLSRHRQLFPLLVSGRPVLHPEVAYIAPCATLIGSVFVGRQVSIWYGAVLRGDTCENASSFHTRYSIEADHPSDGLSLEASTSRSATSETVVTPQPWPLSPTRHRDQLDHHGGAIFIGDDTNLQDACVITAAQNHCRIGRGVTIGHAAQLHSCTVQDFALIGMGSVLQPGVVVETEAFVAAGAVVPADTVVRSGTLWVGNPARYVRDLTPEQREKLHFQSREYVAVAGTHRQVMELGGNVDPELGVAVCFTSDEEEQDAAALEGETVLTLPAASETAKESSSSSSQHEERVVA